MEVKVVVEVWQIFVLLVGFAGAFSVVAHLARVNAVDLKDLKNKCENMMEEDIARKTFVTMELYKNEVHHLNKTVADIKAQNNQILTILTTRKGQ